MIQQLIVRPPAVEDVVEAGAWYDKQTAGLGEELLDAVVGAIRRAASNPELLVGKIGTSSSLRERGSNGRSVPAVYAF